MDVEMHGAGMIGVSRENPFEQPIDFCLVTLGDLCAGLAGRPVVPWLGVHQRLGGEHADLRIVRIARRHFDHCVGVSRIEGLPIGLGIVRIAPRQRGDQRLLLGACTGGGLRLGDGRHCRRDRIRTHPGVDVGADDIGFAPVAERAIGIELPSVAEGTPRLRMIEGVGQPKPLVEELLRFGVGGGYGVMQRAEIVPQRRRRFLGGCRRWSRFVVMGLIGDAAGRRGQDDGSGDRPRKISQVRVSIDVHHCAPR